MARNVLTIRAQRSAAACTLAARWREASSWASSCIMLE